MELRTYLDLLHDAELALATSFRTLSFGHRLDGDVHFTCRDFAAGSAARAGLIGGLRASRSPSPQPTERIAVQPIAAARTGPCGLLRDLQEVHQLATLVQTTWALVGQAAAGARDRPLQAAVAEAAPKITQEADWLVMRMKAEAPQVLLVGIAPGVPT